MKLYVAGPMSGLPGSINQPSIRHDRLREMGYVVISPAEKDREWGQDPDAARTGRNSLHMPDVMRWDLQQVLACDGIVLLPGWENSPAPAWSESSQRVPAGWSSAGPCRVVWSNSRPGITRSSTSRAEGPLRTHWSRGRLMLVYLGCDLAPRTTWPSRPSTRAAPSKWPSAAPRNLRRREIGPQARDRNFAGVLEAAAPAVLPRRLAMECSAPDPTIRGGQHHRPVGVRRHRAGHNQVRMGSTPLEIFLPTPDEWRERAEARQAEPDRGPGRTEPCPARLIMARIPCRRI
jgi:hypothetical protein